MVFRSTTFKIVTVVINHLCPIESVENDDYRDSGGSGAPPPPPKLEKI